MKAGQYVIGLQMGTHKCASQSGMVAHGKSWHLYDPKNHIPPPIDHSAISLQMGTNKCASQVSMTPPRTQQNIYETKLRTDKCDNASMSLQMGYMQGAKQSSQVFGRYMTPSTTHKAQQQMGFRGLPVTAQAQEQPRITLLLPRGG